MALINCPECGREISDKAASCPHCGVPITAQVEQSPESTHGFRETQLGDVKKGSGSIFAILFGLMIMCAGFVCIMVGEFAAALIAIVVGLVMMILGAKLIKGLRAGKCPYCGVDINVAETSATIKCPHCNKVSSIADGKLKAIE